MDSRDRLPFNELMLALALAFAFVSCSGDANTDLEEVYSSKIESVDKSSSISVDLRAGDWYLGTAQQHGADIAFGVITPQGTLISQSDVANQLRGSETVIFLAQETGSYEFSITPTIPTKLGAVDLSVYRFDLSAARDVERLEAEKLVAPAMAPNTTWDPVYWSPRIEMLSSGRESICRSKLRFRCAQLTGVEAWLTYKYMEDWERAAKLSKSALGLYTNSEEMDRAHVQTLQALAMIEVRDNEPVESANRRRVRADRILEDSVKAQSLSQSYADASWSRNALGTSLYYQGKQAEAEVAFLDSIRLASEAAAIQLVDLYRKNFSVVARSDEYVRNLDSLEDIASSLDRVASPEFFALTKFQLGERYLELGRWMDAIAAFAEAKKSATSPGVAALTTVELARAYMEAGRPHRAKVYLAEAKSLGLRTNENPVKLRVLLLEAELSGTQQESSLIAKKLQREISSTYAASSVRDKGRLDLALSNSLWTAGLETESIAAASLAVDRLRRSRDKPELLQALLAWTSGLVSRKNSNDLEIAADNILELETLVELVDSKVAKAELESLKAVLTGIGGDIEEATEASKRSVKIALEQRQSVGSDEYRFGQLRRLSKVYVRHANRLYLNARSRNDETFSDLFQFVDFLKSSRMYQSRARADTFRNNNDLEQRRISELTRELATGSENRNSVESQQSLEAAFLEIDLQSASANDLPAPAVFDLTHIQKAIPENTVLLQYWLKGGEALLWVIDADRFETIELGDSKELRAALRSFHRDLSSGHEPVTKAQVQLRRILTPEGILRSTTTEVLLVLDSELLAVPMGLFFDSAVSLRRIQAPSLLLLEGRASRTLKSISLFGNPKYSKASQLVPLPGAESEVRAIKERFDWESSDLYVGQFATRKKLLETIGRHDIVHIAAHGVMNVGSPVHSGVALSDESSPDSFLTLSDIKSSDLSNVRLLVLSGCSTAFGEEDSLEGMAGFPAEALAAGADKVLVSLWDVPDAATAYLMQEFYSGIVEKGLSPQRALRFAQGEVRGKARWRHPRYWGAWVLVGL